MFYYFLASALPALSLKAKLELTCSELLPLMEWNLSGQDWQEVQNLRSYIDIRNIKALFLKRPLDPRGNLDAKGLNEALLFKDLMGETVFDFLEKYPLEEKRLKHFPELLSGFLQEPKSLSPFLNFYFRNSGTIKIVP